MTARQPDIVNRMLDPVKPWTCGKHPAGKNPIDLFVELDLVDLDKGICLRCLGDRAGIAGPRFQSQSTELNHFINRHRKSNNSTGDFVETGKIGKSIDDPLGPHGRACQTQQGTQQRSPHYRTHGAWLGGA